MIIFHEGLPGSGKSYAAVVEHLIPALKKRRLVYARLDGLDNETCLANLSRVCEIPIDELPDYLIYLPKDADIIRSIATLVINGRENDFYVRDGSFLLLDEIKDFFPATRELPPKSIINFVGEHRKRGIDILAIDQHFIDVHQIFRRRVDTLYRFTKLDYFGLPNHYRYIVFRAVPGDKETKLVRLKSGFEKYRSVYYSCYKSFITDESSPDYEQYNVGKSNFLKTPKFIFALVLAVFLLVFGFGYLKSFFSSDPKIIKDEDKPKSSALVNPVPMSQRQPVYDGPPVSESKPSKSEKELEYEHIERMRKLDAELSDKKRREDQQKKAESDRAIEAEKSKEYVRGLMRQGRPRIAGFMSDLYGRSIVTIEFCDDTGRVFDRLNADQLDKIGWELLDVQHNFLRIRNKKYGDDYVVTSWPIQQLNRVPESHNNQVRERPLQVTASH